MNSARGFTEPHGSHPSESGPSPDFAALAEAMGGAGLRVTDPSDVDRMIEQAMRIDDRPVVIDFRVAATSETWPTVEPGVDPGLLATVRRARPTLRDDDPFDAASGVPPRNEQTNKTQALGGGR